MTVPVRHKQNLYEEGCNVPAPDLDKREPFPVGQNNAREYYLNGGFRMWEVNARNLMLEFHLDQYRNYDTIVPDAIAIAYVPYNRAAYNATLSYPAYSGYYDDLTGRDRIQKAGQDPFRVLLGGTLSVGWEGMANGKYTYSWYAGLTGSGTTLSYELALIIAYGVDKKWFIDTAYGAIEYRHRGSDNPYGDETPNPNDDFTCNNPTTFFLSPGFTAGYYALTTKELRARGGWPNYNDPVIRRQFRDHYESVWTTGFPPC
jgi:hypothetical protein